MCGNVSPETKPTVLAPKDVQPLPVQLDTLDQQLRDPLLLDRKELFPDCADALHGNHHMRFIEFGTRSVLLAGSPRGHQNLWRAQGQMDLLQNSRFDLGCGQRTDIRSPRLQGGSGIPPLVQVGHVIAVEPSVFLLGEMVNHALPIRCKQQTRQQCWVFGAVLTTFYMFRLLFLVFYGTYRGKAHAHESPLTMTVPLMVLAVLSVVGGALNLPHLFGGHEPMKHFLESAAAAIRSEEIELSASTEWILMGITAVLVFTTIAFAYGRFVKRTTLEGDEADMPLLKRLIAQRWRVDELYAALFEKPYGWLSEHFHSIGELRIMVPLQNGVGEAALRVGNVVRKLQTGNASFHLLAMVAGIILFLVITLLSN